MCCRSRVRLRSVMAWAGRVCHCVWMCDATALSDIRGGGYEYEGSICESIMSPCDELLLILLLYCSDSSAMVSCGGLRGRRPSTQSTPQSTQCPAGPEGSVPLSPPLHRLAVPRPSSPCRSPGEAAPTFQRPNSTRLALLPPTRAHGPRWPHAAERQ